MAMTREQAIDRAKKLMSLGNSDNPHEAALAVSRAQELLSRHAIEMADLSIGGEEAKGSKFTKEAFQLLENSTFSCSKTRISLKP